MARKGSTYRAARKAAAKAAGYLWRDVPNNPGGLKYGEAEPQRRRRRPTRGQQIASAVQAVA